MESRSRDQMCQWVRMCNLEIALLCLGSGSDFSLFVTVHGMVDTIKKQKCGCRWLLAVIKADK